MTPTKSRHKPEILWAENLATPELKAKTVANEDTARNPKTAHGTPSGNPPESEASVTNREAVDATATAPATSSSTLFISVVYDRHIAFSQLWHNSQHERN